MAPLQKSLAIRTLKAHEWPKYREVRLRSLADSLDAFGSTLAAEQDRTPDAWALRLSAAAVTRQLLSSKTPQCSSTRLSATLGERSESQDIGHSPFFI
jgi:hypothetical protein